MIHFVGINKALKQVDRRNANQSGGEFDFEDAGVNVRKPLWLVWMAFKAQSRNEGFVTAHDDHNQQVRDHYHIDEAKDDKHNFRFGDEANFLEQMPQFDHEMVNINSLGDYEAEVERGLQPSAQKYKTTDCLFKIRLLVWRLHSSGANLAHGASGCNSYRMFYGEQEEERANSGIAWVLTPGDNRFSGKANWLA